MIRILLLATFFLLFSKFSGAQTNTDYNCNIGVKIYSYTQTPPLLNQDIKKSDQRIISGVLLKFNDNQLAYRVGFDWFNKSNYNFAGSDSTHAVGKYSDYSFKLGFEHDLSVSKLKPSFGIDLGFFHSDFTGNQIVNNTSFNHNLSTLKNGVSVNPFVGLKYTFIPRFYVSIESALSFIYSYNRVQTNGLLQGVPTVSRYNKGDFLISPISFIGLHYNFGAAN